MMWLAASGAPINFFFGTFVEAAYPFMFADKKVFAVAIFSATLGGLTVGAFGAEATAYLPAFIAPFVSTTAVGMTVAMLVALSSSFLLTLAVNVLHLRKAEPATT